MTRIVAARMWTCEFCSYPLYEKKDIIEHLKEKHDINPLNLDVLGDNLIEAQFLTIERECRIA